MGNNSTQNSVIVSIIEGNIQSCCRRASQINISSNVRADTSKRKYQQERKENNIIFKLVPLVVHPPVSD